MRNAPSKQCPKCSFRVPIAKGSCTSCGHIFPKKKLARKYEEQLLTFAASALNNLYQSSVPLNTPSEVTTSPRVVSRRKRYFGSESPAEETHNHDTRNNKDFRPDPGNQKTETLSSLHGYSENKVMDGIGEAQLKAIIRSLTCELNEAKKRIEVLEAEKQDATVNPLFSDYKSIDKTGLNDQLLKNNSGILTYVQSTDKNPISTTTRTMSTTTTTTSSSSNGGDDGGDRESSLNNFGNQTQSLKILGPRGDSPSGFAINSGTDTNTDNNKLDLTLGNMNSAISSNIIVPRDKMENINEFKNITEDPEMCYDDLQDSRRRREASLGGPPPKKRFTSSMIYG